jgi:phage/plasmid-like protein (TIGR03299 family)
MAHKVENMAYTKSDGKPWHGLGIPVSDDMTTEAMMKAAGVNWTVTASPLFYKKPDGTYAPVEGGSSRVLLRDSDGNQLTTMGEKWKPTQNHEAIGFFDEFIRTGGMSWNTMGSLSGGRYVFALASIKKEVNIAASKQKADRVGGFLLLALPHVFGKAMIFKFTGIRVVCWNTLTAALGSSFGKGRMNDGRVTFPHSVTFDEKAKERAKQALGLATTQLDEYAGAAKALSKVRVSNDDLDQYFCEVLELSNDDYTAIKAGKKKAPAQLTAFRESLIDGPGADLPTAAGTLWGGVNAVTHAIDHKYGRGDNTRMQSSWFGNQELVKQRAMDLALAHV